MGFYEICETVKPYGNVEALHNNSIELVRTGNKNNFIEVLGVADTWRFAHEIGNSGWEYGYD